MEFFTNYWSSWIVGLVVIVVLWFIFWKTWPVFRRVVTWVFYRQHQSIKGARDQRDQLLSSDRERVGKFLTSQYGVVSEARKDLQEAIENRDELVVIGANAVAIAAAEAPINTRQLVLDQAEEVLRIRERRAHRLYPSDFRWLQR